MKKFQVYLDADEIDYIVEQVLADSLKTMEEARDNPKHWGIYSDDPKEEKKAIKKAIKAYKFVLGEFRP